MPMPGEQREAWGSRVGLILAAAGNAIGIGNLLRFPGQAATNGGGAFMVPYVICLLLFGLPMMWVAWTIGRYGGRFGHGTTPGMFDKLWRAPIAKYLGVLGVAIPLVFCLFYTYIEAWCLGYSYFSLTGDYVSTPERHVDLGVYLNEFLDNTPTHTYFPTVTTALVFLLITLGFNIFVLYRGVAKGIEILAKVAVPLLFLFCLILAVRVFTLEPMSGSAWKGLEFLWTPDLTRLAEPKVWVAAAGQIFFTLSIGIGSLECYGSYLKDRDDITLTGLSTASMNEFVEVIFGSLIAIPAAAVFFGDTAADLEAVAKGGTFSIGMISMPEVLRSIPGVQFFGTVWFLLLFLAAFTSSVAVCQPVIAFLTDEARLKRGMAAMIVGLVWLLGTLPVIYFFKYGVLDEMDFWAGTIGLVAFSAIEAVIFAWIFGMDRGWEEMHRGADLHVPRVFYHIIKWVTPICLILIFAFWFVEAIGENTLIPSPKVSYGVMDRGAFRGDFQPPPLPAPPAPAVPLDDAQKEAAEAAAEAASDAVDARQKALEARLHAVASEERRDLRVWIDLRVAEDGRTLTVSNIQGEPKLAAALSEAELAEYLSLGGFGYRVRRAGAVGEKSTLEPASAQAKMIFDVLYAPPFIWLTRVIIVAITLLFLVSVRVIWSRRREEETEAGGAGAPAGA